MSFMKVQRLITLIGRLAFFTILFFSFRTARIPSFFFLSTDGSAALYALILIVPLGHASSFWFMMVSNLSFIAVLYALADLVIRKLSWYNAWRTFTLHGLLPFLLCILYLLIGLAVAKIIRKKRCPIATSHSLPNGRLRVIQMADIHPWKLQTKREVARLYKMINEENPDVIVLTGDIFDENTTPKMFRSYLEMFAALHPKYGIYYVFGNHDTGSHWKKPAHTREDILRGFAAVGITVLEDEAVDIADGMVRIFGRRDLDEPRMTPAELMQSSSTFDGFKMLLCHEPVEFSECAAAGADLILAGHTHGGQIFPVGLISNKLLKLHDGNAGKIQLDGGATAIVTSGVGTWSYPVRTEARSEIVIIDLYQE